MEATMKRQMNKRVSSLPYFPIEFVRILLIKLTTGLDDCFVSAPNEDDPVLNISSRKGISIPIDTIEKTMDSMVHKK
jgi:hypothetical protein